ncbi:MAG: InlB B-repeat-containing protein [Clostridia bacterium]|nr:InlB B-repeat-containing protein [Clostridia bacterium]
MKRKIIVILSVILLISITVTMLAGCDQIFTKNDKRDAEQVVATVSYGGQTADVYKFELEASFNNYAYYYTYYYGMTYEEAADYIVKSLAQQKLLTLYAIEQVSNKKGIAIPSDISVLLSSAEKDHAIKDVNKSLLSSLKTIVEAAINEDNYNKADKSEETEEEKIADDAATIYVKFNSNGGSEVTKQKLKAGQKATEPDVPTYDGYMFYGWYDNAEFDGEKIDFKEVKFTQTTTLFAKWEKYLAPRTVKPEEEDDEDADYDPEGTVDNISATFFEEEYQNTLYDEFKGEEFVKDMMVAEGSNAEKVLKDYISDGVATLKKNMVANLHKDTYEECYAYYLNAQYETLIVERYKRQLGDACTVSNEEVNAEFNRLVQNNIEKFGKSETAYSTALTSSLSTTYYHPFTVDANNSGYGFVNNILLKLNQEDVNKLLEMVKNNPSNKKAIEIERNRLISKMEINISNPSYYNGDDKTDIENELKDADIEIIDPMTDPNNKYNNVNPDGSKADAAKDTKYEKDGGNNYEQIIEFKNVDGKWQIVYNATEAPTMPYLLNAWPAFDLDGKTGIIHQIQNTFDQVRTAGLSVEETVYWLREVATEWLYLVGDDAGSLSTDSNNNGLGYLVTPDGKDSSFITGFTEYARELIKDGTGSSTVSAPVYSEADEKGVIAGDKTGYVVADSFIESGSTASSGYAGVFVLLCSYKAWDASLYNNYSGNTLGDGNTLPSDYIITFAESKEDAKTIRAEIKDSLLESKKADAYSVAVNTMTAENEGNIQYFNKVYKSIWKDLEK